MKVHWPRCGPCGVLCGTVVTKEAVSGDLRPSAVERGRVSIVMLNPDEA